MHSNWLQWVKLPIKMHNFNNNYEVNVKERFDSEYFFDESHRNWINYSTGKYSSENYCVGTTKKG